MIIYTYKISIYLKTKEVLKGEQQKEGTEEEGREMRKRSMGRIQGSRSCVKYATSRSCHISSRLAFYIINVVRIACTPVKGSQEVTSDYSSFIVWIRYTR